MAQAIQTLTHHDSSNQATEKKSSTLRDSCIQLLELVKVNTTSATLANKVEQLCPQLERHIALTGKLKRWFYAEQFDAIGSSQDARLMSGTELFNISTRLLRTPGTIEKTTTCQRSKSTVTHG